MSVDAQHTSVPERIGRCLAQLPLPASPRGARASVAAELHREGAVVVVLDDDAAGGQALEGAPLLLRFEDADLEWALGSASDVVVALTDSRVLPQAEAVALGRTLTQRIATVARRLGAEPRIVSRGDSALRGHFPAEVDAVADGLRAAGAPVDAVLLCPAFPEAGHITVGSVHCLLRDSGYVPVAESELASDPVLGYAESDLRDWAAARTGVAREQIGYVNLADIRLGGAARVAELLGDVRGGQVVVLDAATREDLEVLALGIAQAEHEGRRFLCRTGPSFVSARAGRALPQPLTTVAGESVPCGGAHGLVVVGAHSEPTARRLRRAIARHGIARIELDVAAVLDPARRDHAVACATAALASALWAGDAMLAPSRAPVPGADGTAARAAIDAAIVAVVQRVAGERTPAWVIAEGGSTAPAVVRRALHAGRATVLGQLLPGQAPVWRLEDGPHRGLPCVACPGDAGDDDTLAEAIGRLRAPVAVPVG